MSEEEYSRLISEIMPPSPVRRDCFHAFWVGGAICLLGQALRNFYIFLGAAPENAAMLTSVTLIFLSALLTGLGVYDDLAKYAGAGTLVPITGFANAVSAPAVEFQTEGFITGIGAKMFTIAGPVIVYGTAASVIYGIFYALFTR